MAQESHAGIIVDRCPACSGLWFDATELDAFLHSLEKLSAHPPWEQQIPDQGYYGHSCPRCLSQQMASAGWSTLLLARCPCCKGLYVDAGKLLLLERADIAGMGPSFEQELLSIGNRFGWAVLGGRDSWALVGRVLDSIYLRK
jgi:Zn-finger nucleic acid-binding protein